MKSFLNYPTTYMFMVFVLLLFLILRQRYFEYRQTKFEIKELENIYKNINKQSGNNKGNITNSVFFNTGGHSVKTNGFGFNLPISTRSSLKKKN